MYAMFSLIVLFGAIIISLTNKEKIKFKVGFYLKELSNDEERKLRPYFRGAFILGMMFPILVYLGTDGVETLFNYFNQTKLEKIHAYEYIGRCYVDKDCRQLVIGNHVQTDDAVINLTGQIRQNMISKMKSDNKKGNQ